MINFIVLWVQELRQYLIDHKNPKTLPVVIREGVGVGLK
jgi:predicted metal-dependent TIM-barrel fold hydrolase